jgi:hypothetical protein
MPVLPVVACILLVLGYSMLVIHYVKEAAGDLYKPQQVGTRPAAVHGPGTVDVLTSIDPHQHKSAPGSNDQATKTPTK